MFIAVPAAISIVNILAAFEVLSAIYLPHSTTLFTLIVAVGGASSVFFTCFAIGDSWYSGPTEPLTRKLWLDQQWIKTRPQGYELTYRVALVATSPIAVGVILRLCHVSVRPTTGVINWIVFFGLALAISGTYLSARRAQHHDRVIEDGCADGKPLALR